jgi:hypothetical protein
MNDFPASPANPLETAIATVEQSPEDDAESRRAVLTTLIGSRVAVLLDRPWDGISQTDEPIQLQFVSDGPHQEQPMLAVFSAIENAQRFGSEYNAFEHAVEVDAGWALLGIGKGQGLIINPNLPFSFRVSPDIASGLRDILEQSLNHGESNDDGTASTEHG